MGYNIGTGLDRRFFIYREACLTGQAWIIEFFFNELMTKSAVDVLKKYKNLINMLFEVSFVHNEISKSSNF